MSGQKKKYSEMLKNTPYPQMSPDIFKVCIDYHALRDYARSKGVSINDLRDEEKDMFILNSNMNNIKGYS